MTMERNRTNIAAIVVVYNTFCGDSSTCQSLSALDRGNVRIVVYDNSTRDYGNQMYCSEKRWNYLGGKGNKGLSVAYNRAIEQLKQDGFSGIVCLFDDDTHLDSSYFDAVERADWTKSNIYVPFIFSSGQLISPCIGKKNFADCSTFGDEQEARDYAGKDLSAINSAMALNISLFDDYQYDENLFLECIDHKFLMDMKEKGESIGFMDYRCRHELSAHANPSKAAALARFRIYAKDLRYLLKSKSFAYLWIVGRRMQYLVRCYRSFAFLWIFIRAFFNCSVSLTKENGI